jgi:DUF2945 family protein
MVKNVLVVTLAVKARHFAQCRECQVRALQTESAAIMTDKFKVGDRVSWKSEAGRVSGTIVRVHRRAFDVKGYTHHASAAAPQYEIKSAKTDHTAFHKGSALRKLRSGNR